MTPRLAAAARCMDDEFLLSQLESGNLHERDVPWSIEDKINLFQVAGLTTMS